MHVNSYTLSGQTKGRLKVETKNSKNENVSRRQGCLCPPGTEQTQVDCCLVRIRIAGAFGQDFPSRLRIWEMFYFPCLCGGKLACHGARATRCRGGTL